MVSALFTALALIAAGQGGQAPSETAPTQMRSAATSEVPATLRASRRAAAKEHRNR